MKDVCLVLVMVLVVSVFGWVEFLLQFIKVGEFFVEQAEVVWIIVELMKYEVADFVFGQFIVKVQVVLKQWDWENGIKVIIEVAGKDKFYVKDLLCWVVIVCFYVWGNDYLLIKIYCW